MKYIKIIIYIIPLFILSCGDTSTSVSEQQKIIPPQTTDSNFPRLIYTQDQINFVAEKINEKISPWYLAYIKLINIADSYKDRKATATADFHIPAYYDNSEDNINAKSDLALDSHAAHTNALAYALTGKTKYAEKAIYFLKEWATINTSITELDSLGETTGTVLTATNLMSGFLIAADLLSGQDIWAAQDKETFYKWVENVLLPNTKSIKGKANNWGDWGTFATAASYHILGKHSELLTEIERMKSRIDTYQNEDGSMPQETKREANGLWYTYFALTPITLSAQLAFNTTGVDLFNWKSKNGKTIQKALDYLEYYENHKLEWPWFPMTNSAIDKDAPTDLFEAMNDYYNNEYDSYSSAFRPVLGGYKGSRVSHTGWNFPTLMKMPKRTPSKYRDLQ